MTLTRPSGPDKPTSDQPEDDIPFEVVDMDEEEYDDYMLSHKEFDLWVRTSPLIVSAYQDPNFVNT